MRIFTGAAACAAARAFAYRTHNGRDADFLGYNAKYENRARKRATPSSLSLFSLPSRSENRSDSRSASRSIRTLLNGECTKRIIQRRAGGVSDVEDRHRSSSFTARTIGVTNQRAGPTEFHRKMRIARDDGTHIVRR